MIFFVYVDCTTDEPARPFYVGKGTKKRVQTCHRSELHSRFARKHGCERSVVFETDDEMLALAVEIELISCLKTYAHGGPDCWGANLSLGGEGVSGAKLPKSPETRAKMSAAAMGHGFTDETRMKMSAARKNRVVSDETRRKLREARARVLERGISDETRKKLSTARRVALARGDIYTPEVRKKMSDSKKNLSDETRRRMSEAQRLRHARQRKS